jgi:hypothetical protein
VFDGQVREAPAHVRLFKSRANTLARHARSALTAQFSHQALLGWFSQTQPMPKQILQLGSGTPCPRNSVSAEKLHAFDSKFTGIVGVTIHLQNAGKARQMTTAGGLGNARHRLAGLELPNDFPKRETPCPVVGWFRRLNWLVTLRRYMLSTGRCCRC